MRKHDAGPPGDTPVRRFRSRLARRSPGRAGVASVALAAAFALTIAGCGTSGGRGAQVSRATAAPPAPPAPIRWTGCGGGFTCGQVGVPTDYTDAGGGTANVAVIRRPADDPSRRIGVLVFNPGGPGLSGIAALRAAAAFFPAQIRGRFDIVSFDPRGTGASAPLTCGLAPGSEGAAGTSTASPSGATASPSGATASPSGATAVAPATAAAPVGPPGAALPATVPYRTLAADCARKYPRSLPFVNTADTARDLDRIRAAIGAATVSFVGLSYGTLLGLEYQHLFPSRVRAVVLDGPIDPSEKLSAAASDQADAAELALRSTLTRCPAGASCPLSPHALAPFDAVRRRLASGALPAPGHGDSTPVTEGDLDLATLTYLSAPDLTPDYLPALAAAARGDGSALRRLAAEQFTDLDGTSVLGAYWAITCNDSAERPSTEQAGALARTLAARDPRLGGEAASFFLGACPVWPAAREPLGAVHLTAPAAPVLVLGGVGDPITPIVWAERVTTELGRAALVKRYGFGHTAFLNAVGNTCIDGYETAYLVSLTVPPAGAECGR